MRYLIFLLSCLIFFSSQALGEWVIDPLHGIRVDLPPAYTLNVRSAEGRIILRCLDRPGGIVIFPLKNPKKADEAYLLRVLSLPFYKQGEVFFKTNKNFSLALVKAPYLSFSPYFDQGFIFRLYLKGLANQETRAALMLTRGKKYSLAVLFLPPPGESLERLFKLYSSFKWEKPTVPFKRIEVRSKLFEIPALWIDIPKGFSLKHGLTLTQNGEMPEIIVSGPNGSGFALLGFIGSRLVVAQGFGVVQVADIFDPLSGNYQLVSQPITTHDALIKFYCKWLGLSRGPEIIFLSETPYPLLIGAKEAFYFLKADSIRGWADLIESRITQTGGVVQTMAGSLILAYGPGNFLYQSLGGLFSIETNAEWEIRNMRFAISEARKEIAHQRWMWREFRKTQDYINRLHRQQINAEEVYQEEMARALTNVLSDYTYARDPETGEVFHLEDTSREYWRDVEGDIYGFENTPDERLLEAHGFKRIEVRLEGFGKW